MKVETLEIKRPASYETDAGKLKGIVTLSSSTGRQTYILSARAINSIMGIIATETASAAVHTARRVETAILESGQEAILTETDGVLLLEESIS